MPRAHNVAHELAAHNNPGVKFNNNGEPHCGKCDVVRLPFLLTYVDQIKAPFEHLRPYIALCDGCRETLWRGSLVHIRRANRAKKAIAAGHPTYKPYVIPDKFKPINEADFVAALS